MADTRSKTKASEKTSVPVSKVAAAIVKISDESFSNNLRHFYDALHLPSTEYGRLKLQYTIGVENYYGLISKILQDWVTNVGSFATTYQLIQVLKSIQCIALAETLGLEFSTNCKLIIGHASNSPGSTPYRIPVFFGTGLANPHFIGRNEEIEQLLDSYKAFRQSSEGIGINIITGTSGIGKSFLARHFCHQIRQVFPTHSCIWIRGDSPSTTKQSLAEVASYLQIEITPESKNNDVSQDIMAIHAKHNGTPVTLVISNVRIDNEVVRRLIIALNNLPAPRVFVVMTSTYLNIPGIVANEIHLEFFAKEQGSQLINSIVDKNHDSQPFLDLGKNLPLATVLIANWCKHHGDFDKILKQRKGSSFSTYNLLKSILESILNITENPDLIRVACNIVNILIWVFPTASVKLEVLKNVYQGNFKDFSESTIIAGLSFLQNSGIVQVHPMVLNSSIYNTEPDEFVEKVVECHPMIRSILQEMLHLNKLETFRRFVLKFGRLDKSSQKYFIACKEDLLLQNIEIKESRDYSNLKNSLLLAENPTDIFIPWIRKLTVFSLVGFIITLINLGMQIMQIVTTSAMNNIVDLCLGLDSSTETASDIFQDIDDPDNSTIPNIPIDDSLCTSKLLGIAGIIWMVLYIIYSGVVMYFGVKIVSRSAKFISKNFVGDVKSRRNYLWWLSFVLAAGYLVLIGLVATQKSFVRTALIITNIGFLLSGLMSFLYMKVFRTIMTSILEEKRRKNGDVNYTPLRNIDGMYY